MIFMNKTVLKYWIGRIEDYLNHTGSRLTDAELESIKTYFEEHLTKLEEKDA